MLTGGFLFYRLKKHDKLKIVKFYRVRNYGLKKQFKIVVLTVLLKLISVRTISQQLISKLLKIFVMITIFNNF